ncbi:hypothetical protein PoB_007532100 [Plakobranchus ocellatus]|uniref:Uncharacterized protein n=1 Tax=Plakobranchus ocellatus TaxID=259542 RepID=A0AAV4DXJ3_9GAST|nr:hypothetical protein PoB_007532100 [Plakobranchus ocellatus]
MTSPDYVHYYYRSLDAEVTVFPCVNSKGCDLTVHPVEPRHAATTIAAGVNMNRSGIVSVTASRSSGNLAVRKPLLVPVSGPLTPSSCPSFVHSKVTLYHASKIDLRYCRSLHSCGACNLGRTADYPCGAVHYGICAAVKPAPTTPSKRQLVLRRAKPGTGASSSPGTTRPHAKASQPPSPTSPYSPSGVSGNASQGPPRFSSSLHYNTNSTTGGGSSTYAEAGSQPSRRAGAAPLSRSLTILREGHELAGTQYDTRGAAAAAGYLVPTSPLSPLSPGGGHGHHQQHPGLLRLHPHGRQQLVINSHNLRDLAAMGDVYPANVIDHSRAGDSNRGGGGVAITIQQHGGRTNITSSGLGAPGVGPDIKIEGEGHEIVIQGAGGGRQNIRVSQPWSGGRSGPVIRIQGQGHQGHVHYRPGIGVVVASPPESPSSLSATSPTPYIVTSPPPTPPPPQTPSPFDYPDATPPQNFPPSPKSFSSSTQIVPRKPTARVAPAPSSSPSPSTPPSSAATSAVPSQASDSDVVSPPPSSSLTTPPSSESPAPSCSPTPIPTPPFPILSPVESASPSPSPPPQSSTPSSVEPTVTPSPIKTEVCLSQLPKVILNACCPSAN